MTKKELKDKVDALCLEYWKTAENKTDAIDDVINVAENVYTSGVGTFINSLDCPKADANKMLDKILGGLEDHVRQTILSLYDENQVPHTRIEV